MPFAFLRHVDRQNMLTYIIDEHPQTIALVLSHLPPSFGAEILTGLPEEKRLSVVRRIATMGQTNPEIIHEVEKGLERRMSSVMSQSFENAGGVEAVAEMLNVTDRATERALLDNLGRGEPGPGRGNPPADVRLRGHQQVHRQGHPDGAQERRDHPVGHGAQGRQRRAHATRSSATCRSGPPSMLKEEMDYLGAVKLSAVESKQQEIVDIVRRLEDDGAIEINTSGEVEEMVQ